MTVNRAWYAGREQAFVKHSFLDRYLGRLFNKLASSRDTIVYIDGFAGPWKNSSERFEDTSFGIALSQLRGAKTQANHPIRAIAHLVERDAVAFAELKRIAPRYADIEVVLHNRDFHYAMPLILADIPSDSFIFALLDPKGWSTIDLQRLTPLLARPNSEVVINLMYDFVNRFIDHPNERITEKLNRVLPGPDWREAIKNARTDEAAAREAIVTETFSDALKATGGYRYAPSLRVRRPGLERTLYHLFYGTRSSTGLAVFRESQVKALQEEAVVQSEIKRDKREQKTGMGTLFSSEMEARFDPAEQFLHREVHAAVDEMLRLVKTQPQGVRWAALWPPVLDGFAVSRSALGRELNKLRKQSLVRIPDWPNERKQIPENDYLIWPA